MKFFRSYSRLLFILVLCVLLLTTSCGTKGSKLRPENSTLSLVVSGLANTLRRVSLAAKSSSKKDKSRGHHGYDDYYDYPPPPPPTPFGDPFGPMLLMTLVPIMLLSSFMPALTMFTANSFGLIQNQGISAIPGNTIATGKRRRKRSLFGGPYSRHFRTLSEEVILVLLQRLHNAFEKHSEGRRFRQLF